MRGAGEGVAGDSYYSYCSVFAQRLLQCWPHCTRLTRHSL
jgi:hypothetical protein